MELEKFKIKMEDYLKKLDIVLDENQINQFYNYMNILLEWNKKFNLTAIVEPEEIILKHFIDSLTISKYIKEESKLVDVGTGAGFPGIPLKIYRPDINITLIDSLNKRVSFLNQVIKELSLENIVAIHARAEEFANNKKYRENFDVCTSRAVANLSTLSEYMLPLLNIEGKAICMKGLDVEQEIDKSKKAIKILGGKIDEVDEFLLPNSEMKRNIIIIKKIQNTPLQYPRKSGTPAKSPLE